MKEKERQVHDFIRNSDKDFNEVIKFCELNNIDYAYFHSIEDLFSYYDEEDYKCFSSSIINIIFKDGSLIQILDL